MKLTVGTWTYGALSCAVAVGVVAGGVPRDVASAAQGSAQQWTTPGSYTFTPPTGVNGALVVATGGSGAGVWTGISPSPGAPGGGGAVVTGYLPVGAQPGPWTVFVGGAGVPGNFSDSGPTAGGGGGSSGVYSGDTATSVIAGGGGGSGAAGSGTSAQGSGGSAGNPDGSGQAGSGTDAGNGGAGGTGGSATGDALGKGNGGGNGTGGAGGSGSDGGTGGSGPPNGGYGGSAGDHQLGGGGGGGYGGGASGGALGLFNNYGGGGGGGGSFAPSSAGFPSPLYAAGPTSYNGAAGSVTIATVTPAGSVTATPVANGTVAIDWEEPAQWPGLGNVSYQAFVDGQPVLSAPGTVDGLDPTQTVAVTVVATAGSLTATTTPVTVLPAVSPVLTRVVPSSGSTAGAYWVTIQGSGFLSPAAITVNGAAASQVQVLSDSMVNALVPGGSAGPATVQVTNSGTGLSGSASGLFSYFVPGPATVAPAITALAVAGTPQVGTDLVSEVTASGAPAPTLTYAWSSGPSASGPWTAVPGSPAAPGYVPTQAQIGQYLRVTVTATNGVNPAATQSAVTATAVSGLRAQVGDVGVKGTAQVGKQLAAVVHGLKGVPTPSVAYQWQSRTGSTWSDIAGATAAQFDLTAAQVEQQVRVKVTVDNGVGSAASANSPATQPVRGTTPEIGGVTVSGDAAVGGTLTAAATGVSGVPTPTVRYQWQVGGGGAGTWTDIPGAESATLEVPADAAGQSVRAVAKAHNGVDPRAWAYSDADPVPAIPLAIGKVVIAGKVQIGKTLTADPRDVTGDPTPSLTYRWQRKTGNHWRAVKKGSRISVKVKRAWYRDRLRVRVTATSTAGQAKKVSAATPKVRSARPALDQISPARGSSRGGTRVRISGSGFMPAPRVRIGGARCEVIQVRRSRITCRTSARRPGDVAVIVRNSDGRDAVLPQSFRYTR